MNDLTTFTNPEFGQVRTVEIDGTPWLVGKDVAVALGYAKPTDAIRKHVDPEDKGISKTETPSGEQEMLIINESGLYSLILSSKMPKAKAFKHWVISLGHRRGAPGPAQERRVRDRESPAAH